VRKIEVVAAKVNFSAMSLNLKRHMRKVLKIEVCRWLNIGIKLSKKVLDHIVNRHPEVAAYIHEIVETVQEPDMIIRGLRGELKALRFYTKLHVGPKYMVVVYRELRGEKVIITAYFTSNVAKVKGEVAWKKLR